MQQPAVSVILPAYDRLRQLRLAIEFVRAQTRMDWELVIANDGIRNGGGSRFSARASAALRTSRRYGTLRCMDATGQRRLASNQKLYPRHIGDEVLGVLGQAARGKGPRPQFVTAYQVLQRLPVAVRQNLEHHYGPSGRNARRYFGAASCVAHAFLTVWKRDLRSGSRPRIEIGYLDTRDLQIGPGPIIPSYSVCGLYRRA